MYFLIGLETIHVWVVCVYVRVRERAGRVAKDLAGHKGGFVK